MLMLKRRCQETLIEIICLMVKTCFRSNTPYPWDSLSLVMFWRLSQETAPSKSTVKREVSFLRGLSIVFSGRGISCSVFLYFAIFSLWKPLTNATYWGLTRTDLLTCYRVSSTWSFLPRPHHPQCSQSSARPWSSSSSSPTTTSPTPTSASPSS